MTRGDVEAQVVRLRTSVGVSRMEHMTVVRLRGDGAYDAADRVFPRELYLRDGQLSHGLLLNEDGTVFAECYLASDEADFFLLAETLVEGGVVAHLQRHCGDIDDLEIVDESTSVEVIGIDGPYAWELMARLVGQEVVGLPYLTHFRFDGLTCCRAGKTGEYGYWLVTPRTEGDETMAGLLEAGEPVDAGPVSLEALDRCAIENWFFNIRAEGREPRTPIELQLQWRVSYRKAYVGSDALAAHRAKGIGRRLTCLVADGGPTTGDDVVRDGRVVGRVVNAGYSPLREDHVVLAFCDLPWAHPGIDGFRFGSGASARTVCPPVLDNRSLYVNPQVHSYATREEVAFPPIGLP